jgi:hypothetical protein
MTELRVHNFSLSLDGYAAGPTQDVVHPLGVGGEHVHEWIFAPEGERTPTDDRMQARGTDGIGATIMGRNMFAGACPGHCRRTGGPARRWRRHGAAVPAGRPAG